MMTDRTVDNLVLAQRLRCNQGLRMIIPWFMASCPAIFSILYFGNLSSEVVGFEIQYRDVAALFSAFCLIVVVRNAITYLKERNLLSTYFGVAHQLESARQGESILQIQQTITDAQYSALTNELSKAVLELHWPSINERIDSLRRIQLHRQLESEFQEFRKSCDSKLLALRANIPLIKAKTSVDASLSFLKKRREEISAQWKQVYQSLSWFNKLKYGETPDFSEMDKVVKGLEQTQRRLHMNHEDDFKRVDAHIASLKRQALARATTAHAAADRFVRECGHLQGIESDLLPKALWFSALSVPVSVWIDANQAADVFDALRLVNGNFANMSNADIWWQSLFMPSESLAGLASLTKGAYFEQLVANDTGGALFQHFNHPDTDIVIDGVAWQLKATASADYVNSVEDSIPVIATSEVAAISDAVDSGFSNEQLTAAVDLALGGTVVDLGDTAVDAIISGLGGLGLFATIKGINHAGTKYENGGDGVEAMFEGAGIAIEGTARAIVGAAELGYNVVMSRPSRFVGRMLLKGFVRLDQKLTGQPPQKGSK